MDPSLVEKFLRGEESEICLLNPRLPENAKRAMLQGAKDSGQRLSDTLWLQSSGTSAGFDSGHKLVALSRENLLCAARMVKQAFDLCRDDRFLMSLPLFHIAGISIVARAHCCRGAVIPSPERKWDPNSFVKVVSENQITVLSLVPTQIFDLVQCKQSAPSSLRWAFVGGGALDPSLAEQAIDLGWPLITCYGMTETSAMIAFNKTPDQLGNVFAPFQEVELKAIADDNEFGPLLVSGGFVSQGVLWVRRGQRNFSAHRGQFSLPDRLCLRNHKIIYYGREDDFVKILGESVNLIALEKELNDFLKMPAVVVAIPEARRGFDLVGVTEKILKDGELSQFNANKEPFLQLQKIVTIDTLPVSLLGKPLRGQIREKL